MASGNEQRRNCTCQATKRPVPIVVFASVDGVLTCSSARSCAVAAAILMRLTDENVTIVLCSGKTRAEVEYLWQKLGGYDSPAESHPFISEHGAAAFIPNAYFPFEVPNARDVGGYRAIEFGRPYATVVQTIRETTGRLGIDIRRFGEMSVEQVASESHLPLLEARLAKLREYGELFRMLDPRPEARRQLFKAFRAAHLRWIGGDPYDHVGGAVRVSVGVRRLRDLYRRACRTPPITVGMVDGALHADLLHSVDHALIMQTRRAGESTGGRKTTAPARRVQAEDMTEWLHAIGQIAHEIRGARQPLRA